MKAFNMKDLDPVKHFLGIHFVTDDQEIHMDQTRHTEHIRYIEQVIERFGITYCNGTISKYKIGI